jgi:tryptophanyl-tRNA synthetase
MAADILLYKPDFVPVGADQKQHLEIARDIADRFNGIYGDVFTVPEPYIAKVGARVMSLQDPTKKMSKSDENLNSWVAILDTPDDIMRKFKRAVTDSGCEVRRGEGKAAIENLMSIYGAFAKKTPEEIEREFDGRGYGDFKAAVGEACADALAPIQAEFNRLMADKAYLEEVMKRGAEEAAYYARKTMSKVRRKLGFVG